MGTTSTECAAATSGARGGSPQTAQRFRQNPQSLQLNKTLREYVFA